MKTTLLCAATAFGLTSMATASDINLRIESGGSSQVNALVGSQVNYEIWAELSDNNNEGLALLCFDLSYDGGVLAQANGASGATQLNFASPLGLNNPAGYGGTASGGNLLQVGGAQNTVKNSLAPAPNGSVMSAVAAAGSPVLFVSGSLNAPGVAGTYHLDASHLIANAIRQGETGAAEFWAVDAVNAGSVAGLTIVVSDCTPSIYCVGKLTSQGCTPSIAASGTASLNGSDDFHITASNIVDNKAGLLFYGLAAGNQPFMGGVLCVAFPLQRTPVQNSGGSQGTSCSGSYDLHFTQARMLAEGLQTGSKFYAQYWFRDPAHTDGTGVGLSNAIEVTLCP